MYTHIRVYIIRVYIELQSYYSPKPFYLKEHSSYKSLAQRLGVNGYS